MFLITMISWGGALLIAKLLRGTVIRGESTPFVMELPPYRLPTFRGLMIHTWERTWQYIKKAGTIILGFSVILWAMMTFPSLPDSKVVEFEARRQALLDAAPAASKDGDGDPIVYNPGGLVPEVSEPAPLVFFLWIMAGLVLLLFLPGVINLFLRRPEKKPEPGMKKPKITLKD